MGTLRLDLRTFMIISRIILRMRNVSDRCIENQNTHFSSVTIFWKLCHLWGNVDRHGRARQATEYNKIQRMRFACWITRATDTNSEYIILTAFPRQQWWTCLNVTVICTLYVLLGSQKGIVQIRFLCIFTPCSIFGLFQGFRQTYCLQNNRTNQIYHMV